MAKRKFRNRGPKGFWVTETNPATGEQTEQGYQLDELSVDEIKRVFRATHGIELSNNQAKKLKKGGTVNIRTRVESPESGGE